ncbi:MAG: glycosyltransferase [Anaerolineales bacterium]|nr:glycosyltransferase [Anaerolineales bacterium]MDW8162317.1 glycosyltransferase [Anaerolineales bacterium]
MTRWIWKRSLRVVGMRVAMISYHTCPLATLGGKDTGGMNVYVRDLTHQLGAMGIHADVFTRSQDEHVPHVLHELGFGNRVVHIPAGPEIPLPKEELVNFIGEFVEGVVKFAARKKCHYDLIHSHYWMSGVVALGLKKIWNVPVVHMFHTLGKMKQRVAQSAEEAEGEYRIEGEKRILEGVDRIVAATPAELAQLQWLYQADLSKIEVIPPGVDLSRFYPIPMDEAKEYIGMRPCERMLLFVGRIEPIKGLDVLFRAIAWMRENGFWQRHPFCLAVIGGKEEGSDKVASLEQERLATLRAEYGLEDLVAFLGKKSQDTLPYYYSAAEVVVVPSHYESFGMVALEAMACGTPVVASNVGGLAYLVQDGITGFTVPVDEPQLLGERIEQILANPDLRRKMGQQAAEFAKGYGWDTVAQKIVSLYYSVLSAGRHLNP